LLVNLVGGTTIRIAPPLTVSRTEIRYALDFFRSAALAVTHAPSGPEMVLSA
jgi:4-aminobutyrate aminotransferase-like enzyme